jgi:hypothetical protein
MTQNAFPDHRDTACIACGYNVVLPFFSDDMPLAMIAWPETAAQAQEMKRLPLRFVRCAKCHHVFNADFRYDNVPYSDKPNLMFNSSQNWSGFMLELAARLAKTLPADPRVVEIGYGDGSFLNLLAQQIKGGQLIGYDPSGARLASEDPRMKLHQGLFDPAVHLAEIEPHLLILRHVIEHFDNPLGFLQKIAFCTAITGKEVLAYIEVPCIDRVLDTGRTTDFYYEHVSHFCTKSFSSILAAANAEIVDFDHAYDNEVVFAIVRFSPEPDIAATVAETEAYFQNLSRSKQEVIGQIEAMKQAGMVIAVWGGVGKAAAFLNHYEINADRVPIVVDSDINKVGTYVPGTGQLIQSPTEIADSERLAIIIPPQWRAMDIVHEIRRRNISPETVLIENDGRLIDFLKEPHPYEMR